MLPRRWRRLERQSSARFVARCGIVSGLLESVFALWVLRLWYMGFFGQFGSAYAKSVLAGGKLLTIAPEVVGEAGFAVLAANPITWVLMYFVLEGLVRLAAAGAAGDSFGVLPLCGLDYMVRRLAPGGRREEPILVVDQVLPGDAGCEFKIASCRKRAGWVYPFTIRYRGGFYQIAGTESSKSASRPHIYSFRRLPPGEVARGLREYHPEDVLNEALRNTLAK